MKPILEKMFTDLKYRKTQIINIHVTTSNFKQVNSVVYKVLTKNPILIVCIQLLVMLILNKLFQNLRKKIYENKNILDQLEAF